MRNQQKLIDEATAENLQVEAGINWIWIEGIQSEELAKAWLARIIELKLEHRGIYRPCDKDLEGYSIRFR